jgi:hypothetical protein
MEEPYTGRIAQPGASFAHTCFLYRPLRRSTHNLPFLLFLPEKGNAEGGTLGDITPGRQVHKQLLTTKYMGSLEFEHLLKDALRDVRQGHVKDMPVNELAILRLMDFEVQVDSSCYEYGIEMSEIYITTYVNEFPDRIGVQLPEPGSGCTVF